MDQIPKGRENSIEEIAGFCEKLISCLHMDLSLDCKEENGVITSTSPGRTVLFFSPARHRF